MEDIWPLVVRFACVMAFAIFLLILNLKTGRSAAGKRFSYYFLWGAIILMILQLIQIALRVNEVTN